MQYFQISIRLLNVTTSLTQGACSTIHLQFKLVICYPTNWIVISSVKNMALLFLTCIISYCLPTTMHIRKELLRLCVRFLAAAFVASASLLLRLLAWLQCYLAWGVGFGGWGGVMDHGQWSMVHGPWVMVHGPWSMVHGPRSMVHGPWSLGHGPWAPSLAKIAVRYIRGPPP